MQTHGAEVHATRQEVLHLRKGLESTFRKTLKDLEGTYRRKVGQDNKLYAVLRPRRAFMAIWS